MIARAGPMIAALLLASCRAPSAASATCPRGQGSCLDDEASLLTALERMPVDGNAQRALLGDFGAAVWVSIRDPSEDASPPRSESWLLAWIDTRRHVAA